MKIDFSNHHWVFSGNGHDFRNANLARPPAMARPAVLTAIFFLWIFQALGQVQIKGRVLDQKTGEPLEFALVEDSLHIQTHPTWTDAQGYFLLRLQATPAWVRVESLGYKSKMVSIANPRQSYVIRLERGALDLQTVTITKSSRPGWVRHLEKLDLQMNPVRSAQSMLRMVPGLFIAQHQGGGKAEQIFLRGFDADHGTDVSIQVDGMPVNLVSQAHGQGYADLHFLIPETVGSYDFSKGPYPVDQGDFCTAGQVSYGTKNLLESNLISLEGGQFSTARLAGMLNLLGNRAAEKNQHAYLAAEGYYSNGGPFEVPEHFFRFNLFGKYTGPLGRSSILTLAISTLSSQWRASGEIPERALSEGLIESRFGAIDSLQGGLTRRTNAWLGVSTRLSNQMQLDQQAYYSYCQFNLISNFTFYYFYPQQGDEFRQHEDRNLFGYHATLRKTWNSDQATIHLNTGLGFRYDDITPSYLAHVQKGGEILGYIQKGRIGESNFFGFAEGTVEKKSWLLSIGLRVDGFDFLYHNQIPGSDSASAIFQSKPQRVLAAVLSPKWSLQYTFDSRNQLFLRLGKGFHSNDARIVIAQEGQSILPAAYGVDLGYNWKPTDHLLLQTVLWYLYLQQEFIYGSDLGDQAVQPGGRTTRLGLDFSARYQITPILFLRMDVNLARPRALGVPDGQNYLPLAPGFTSLAALDLRTKRGWGASLHYRYLHDRPGNADYSLVAQGYWIWDLTGFYRKRSWEYSLSIENLFNRRWNESQFDYTSQLRGETHPVEDMSFTPGSPFFARLKVSYYF